MAKDNVARARLKFGLTDDDEDDGEDKVDLVIATPQDPQKIIFLIRGSSRSWAEKPAVRDWLFDS